MTNNNFILNIICNGYKIQFTSTPIQNNYQHRIISKSNKKICKNKVSEFLKFKIIKVVSPDHDQFISHIFPVAKKTLGEFRIILDLSDLNLFVQKIRFRMDSLSDIINLIQPGDYFTSIDISDAYYCIAMHILSMPYLTFIFLNVYYQFTCLPQGLTSAPRIFTKIIRIILTFLRRQDIRIAAWIDDILLVASSFSLGQEQTHKSLQTFKELGFLPNLEKSQLVPAQRIYHLGLIWDSVEFSISIPKDKIEGVRKKCLCALSYKIQVRFLSSILGSIEYFRWGFPHAALHYRLLQRFVNSCLAKNLSYEDYVFPSTSACIDLSWWSKVGDSLPSRSLSPFEANLEIFCDASETGWGCWSTENKEAFGFWSSSERELHINALEFKAVFFAFRCFFRSTFNCSILIHSDNSTVVSYINNQGGTCSARLCDMAITLWEFCLKRKISISAVHLPGVDNSRADRLSRMENSDHSYSISDSFFDLLCKYLSFPLKVDCFASRLNCKLDNFISRYYDPYSSWVDAFTVHWSDHVYLFPPVPIIHRVISKFKADKTGHGLLICPFWPSQFWFPSLLEILIAPPILIPSDLVLDENNRLPKNCRLVAWIIGSSHAEIMAYRGGMASVGSKGLLGPPLSTIKDVGEGSVLGTIDGKMVTVALL